MNYSDRKLGRPARMPPNCTVGLLPGPLPGLNAAFAQNGVPSALAWWMDHLKPPRRKAAEYPVRVVERGGITALRETPKIIIGTGQSVKGGEADVVYVFPDLSAAGRRSWEGPRSGRDAVVRLGYVMMTRARETLVICEPAGPEYMPIAAIARGTAATRNRTVLVFAAAPASDAGDGLAPERLPGGPDVQG